MMTSPAPKRSPFFTGEKRPPLGVGILLSILRNSGHEIFFSDEYLKKSNILKSDFLFKKKIDFVGIYTNTICFQGTLALLTELENNRKKGWKGKIMVGGPHTSVAAKDFPEFVDYIVIGEGEYAILDIVEGRVTQRIIIGEKVKNLNELPRPAWDMFVNLPYNWGYKTLKAYPIITLNTSRGCPFDCKFCSVNSIWGRNYRTTSAERIFEDILYLKRKYGIKGIYFREDNFTLNKNRVVKLCNLLIENNIDITWICETRADSLQDFDYVLTMAKSGCKVFYIGVESGSPRMLELMNKGITVEHIINAFKNAKEAGIYIYASFIYGLPSETNKDIELTERLIERIKPKYISRNVFVGIPGSELYNYVEENNLYEYRDKNNLLYLKDHNKRVDKYYNGNPYAKIPRTASFFDYRIYEFKKVIRIIFRKILYLMGKLIDSFELGGLRNSIIKSLKILREKLNRI